MTVYRWQDARSCKQEVSSGGMRSNGFSTQQRQESSVGWESTETNRYFQGTARRETLDLEEDVCSSHNQSFHLVALKFKFARINQTDNCFQGAVQTQVWPRDIEHLCQALWSRSVLFREDKIWLHRALSLKQVTFTFSIPLLSSKICLLLSLSQLCNIPQRGDFYFYFHFHIVHFLSKRWLSSHSHLPGNMCTPRSAWRNSKVTRSGNSR